jgi:hypothetical protein
MTTDPRFSEQASIMRLNFASSMMNSDPLKKILEKAVTPNIKRPAFPHTSTRLFDRENHSFGVKTA